MHTVPLIGVAESACHRQQPQLPLCSGRDSASSHLLHHQMLPSFRSHELDCRPEKAQVNLHLTQSLQQQGWPCAPFGMPLMRLTEGPPQLRCA